MLFNSYNIPAIIVYEWHDYGNFDDSSQIT